MTTPRLILATASRWRAQLLEDVGLTVERMPAPIDESAILAPDPVALALARAVAKAEAVATALAGLDSAVVIGADQVAHIDGEAFGKPTDPEDHRRRLRALRGRTHTLTTGVALRGPGAAALGDAADFVEHTHVHFRADVTDEAIDAYVASGDGSECAGGYRAEAAGAFLIEATEGDWTNVIGLPVPAVLERLAKCGIKAC